jgi:electron transport complex protein RnfB
MGEGQDLTAPGLTPQALVPGQALVDALLDALPQTQCTRCGYPDCAAYARAMAFDHAPINQCPPGGRTGIERLAGITGRPVLTLNPVHGDEGPRQIALIDENWCIGCTLCIKACPTDAIVGSHKRMHTVVEPWCTGCELCIPVCPVDCIDLENASGERTGWEAWSQSQAGMSRQRYEARNSRLQREAREHEQRQRAKAVMKLADLPNHNQAESGPGDRSDLDRKRAIIEAALAKARALQRSG